MDAARDLGELRRESRDSEDVTEKYYDLEARLSNKQKQEQRLTELLAGRAGRLDDVLKFEVEMARIREQIERLEGQRRLLADLTALATVTLNIQEIKNYVPEEAATFATRIHRAWASLLAGLQTAGEDVAIVIVYLGPWIVILGTAALLLYFVLRFFRRSRRSPRVRQT